MIEVDGYAKDMKKWNPYKIQAYLFFHIIAQWFENYSTVIVVCRLRQAMRLSEYLRNVR